MAKRGADTKSTKASVQIDASRSTPLWGVNLLRSEVFPSLLNDLTEYESGGFPSDSAGNCDLIKEMLTEVATALQSVPAGGFFDSPIHDDIVRFREVYDTWNGVLKGDEEARGQRRAAIDELKRTRKVFTKKCRMQQLQLSTDLDAKRVKAVYEAIGRIVNHRPGTLNHLARSYGLFVARGGIV